MITKPQPNHRQYLQALRDLGPHGRLMKMFELSEWTKALFFQGLRNRFPEKTEEELREIYLQRIALCHNRNY